MAPVSPARMAPAPAAASLQVDGTCFAPMAPASLGTCFAAPASQLNRKSLPLSIHIPGGGTAAERQVRFSGTQMPLEEFIAELEQQTGCSHQF